MNEDLDTLKAGDEVAYRLGFGEPYEIATIQKRTPSGRIVTRWYTFNADGTVRRRSRYGPYRCFPVTDEIREEVNRRLLCEFLQSVEWSKRSTDCLVLVKECLDSDMQTGDAVDGECKVR